MELSPVSRKICVLVAGNSRIHSQLLANALEQDPDLTVISWDSNSSSPVSTIVSQKVDILAIGSGFAGHPSVALKIVRELRSTHPKTKAVLLLEAQDAELIIDAFRSGARGVFSRESSVDLFRKCIHSVDRGEVWADNRGISLVLDALASSPEFRSLDSAGLSLLSRREFEVVQCVVQGMTNREIAERLGLSQHTVKNYLFRVFDKLGVSSRVELLFMTLVPKSAVRGSSEPPVFSDTVLKTFDGGVSDKTTIALVEKAAEQGAPAAQFFLAQSLAARGESDAGAEAYMWFVVASEQARQAQLQLATKLSAKQIEEARGKALKWIELAKPLASGVLYRDGDESTVQIASLTQEAGKSARAAQTSRKTEQDTPTEPALTFGSA